MHLRKTVTLLLAVVILTGLTTSVAFAQDPDSGKVVYEEQVWQCQRCHWPAGEGAWSRPLAGSEKTAQEWIDQLRNPNRFMPSFSAEQVSDQQITDMHAYFASQSAPVDFAPEMPEESTDPGQNLMLQKRCVACHAEEIRTGQGRMITGYIDRGVTPTAGGVIAQLRTPFKNMPAYRPEQVSDEEAALMAQYLAEQVAAQSAPPSLPQSGSSFPAAAWPAGFLVIGGGLVLTGFILRRATRRV